MSAHAVTFKLETHRREILNTVRKEIRRFQEAGLKRADVAEILTRKLPNAFIYVGGCHVAVHADGSRFGRDVLITSCNPDWR